MSNSKTPADIPPSATEAYEQALARQGSGHYVLRLYVAGMNPRSLSAIENIKALCTDYLPERFDLEIIDIYQQPNLAQEAQIVAAPTLIKELPPPLRKFIGDLSQTQNILAGLDVRIKESTKR